MTSIQNPKTRGFARNIAHSAAKHGAQKLSLRSFRYKTLLQKHSDSIAFISEQEQASLNNMVSEIRLLKAGELK